MALSWPTWSKSSRTAWQQKQGCSTLDQSGKPQVCAISAQSPRMYTKAALIMGSSAMAARGASSAENGCPSCRAPGHLPSAIAAKDQRIQTIT
eukprot:9258029-Lingulodinium_polyedra.AAC.2